jgi:putative cell wall-binding protein
MRMPQRRTARRYWRSRNRVALAAAAALPILAGFGVALTGGDASAAAGLSITRVSGTDRYATAAAIADAGWPSPLPSGSTLLLATGENYPDAVAGAAAAGHLDVPLLLTTHAALSASAAAEISRLKPANVALLGSTSAIDDAVSAQVAALGPHVVRWQGANRYETAAAVSKATYPDGAINVYLATGSAFPDALAGAALAAVTGGPLLLTDPHTLPDATAAELARLHPAAIVVLGSTSAVSDGVADAAVAAVGGAQLSRLQGPDRYQTADAVASVLVQVHGGSSASNGILVATGTNFADALAGAAWAGATDRPMLLVPGAYVTSQTWQAIQALKAPSAVILGGSSAVSASVSSGLQAGNPPTTPPK